MSSQVLQSDDSNALTRVSGVWSCVRGNYLCMLHLQWVCLQILVIHDGCHQHLPPSIPTSLVKLWEVAVAIANSGWKNQVSHHPPTSPSVYPYIHLEASLLNLPVTLTNWLHLNVLSSDIHCTHCYSN